MENGMSTRLSIRKRGRTGGHHQMAEIEDRFGHWRSEEVGHAVCGRCFSRHAALAQVTRVGTDAFHWERRCRVLLRDSFRFGTATAHSLLSAC